MTRWKPLWTLIPGSRLDADHPENGVLIPCRNTSAACIGSSWALQSLWAAAWLTDVEGFDHHSRATQMFLMAVGLSLGALLLGAMADRLRKLNIRTEVLLAGVGALFIVAELALVLRIPLPSLLPWSIVSIAGAATVLSFAVIADYFPN